MRPYYEKGGITIYHGEAAAVLPLVDGDVMLTDPPYGISYSSGFESPGGLARSIEGDRDTSTRDTVLDLWDGPALVFGTWRAPRPRGVRMLLVWDSQGALGMGALDLPWKPAHQEIYVLGKGFSGRRDTDVLSFHPVQATARRGRVHPHEKPIALIRALLAKCPAGTVVDPFMGSGTTLRAAKDEGRSAIGIEIEERYCEIAARRLGQEVLPFP